MEQIKLLQVFIAIAAFVSLTPELVHCSVDDRQGDGLVTVPDNLTADAIVVKLSNNFITSVEDYAFENMTSMILLSMVNNLISTFSDTALYGCTSLVMLDLTKNRLTKVPHLQAVGTGLFQLTLTNNYISVLAISDFIGMTGLNYVDVRFNPILLVEDVRPVLPSLQRLIFSHFDCCGNLWMKEPGAEAQYIVQYIKACTAPEELVDKDWHYSLNFTDIENGKHSVALNCDML